MMSCMCMLRIVAGVASVICDGLRWLWLTLRSTSAVEAENLFLRRQLALYVERGVKPRRIDSVTRIALTILSGFFAWQDALVVATQSKDECGARTRDRDPSPGVSELAHSPVGSSVADNPSLLGPALQSRTAPHGVGSGDSRSPDHSDCQTDFAPSPRRTLRRARRSDPRRTPSRVHIGDGVTPSLGLIPTFADHSCRRSVLCSGICAQYARGTALHRIGDHEGERRNARGCRYLSMR
jgi:hypothetical protein